MKKRIVGFLVFLLFVPFLSSCGEKTVQFSGESVNWKVQYKFTQVGESVESTGTITYIGPEPAPGNIEFSLDNQSGNGPLPKSGVYYLGKSGCRNNCYFPDEDTEFEAIVKWNNRTEKIPLTIE